VSASADAVNMTASELKRWLDTDESRSVGQSDGGESVARRSGRRIMAIPEKRKADVTESDEEPTREVVGYVHRHLAQRPSGDVEDIWRHLRSVEQWLRGLQRFGAAQPTRARRRGSHSGCG
jgi:hypothetical protein